MMEKDGDRFHKSIQFKWYVMANFLLAVFFRARAEKEERSGRAPFFLPDAFYLNKSN